MTDNVVNPGEERPLRSEEELVELFHASETPPSAFRIGTEAEKFGVLADTLAPLDYAGTRGVERVFEALISGHGWTAESEYEGGPLIALQRAGASITLEPGAQFELSGAPLATLHETRAELAAHLAELRLISEQLNLAWLGLGFHPLARQDQLPWVPKQRYAIMREYLPPRGAGAWDMMRRTATVQANYDYQNEEDALRKLRVSLVLAPLVHAMTANSPFQEGAVSPFKSLRGQVWLHMDRERSGLIPALWQRGRKLGYRDYVEWALSAGMFLFKREGRVIANSGQSFRSFLNDGFQGHRATAADWKLHLNTLFPEVRLKNTLEIRACDSLPNDLYAAVPALFTGILYDERALAEAEDLALRFDYDSVERSRPALVRDGLAAEFAGRPARELAVRVLDIAAGGLRRRAALDASGRDESVYLEPLQRLSEAGLTPADRLLQDLPQDRAALGRAIVERARLPLS